MNYFEQLSQINVNDKVEQKNKLSYLSWTYAFSELKKRFPDVTYEVMKFENNLPYVYDENTGYMVFTKVTLEGITNEMWLPVMDGANKAMKSHPYTYQVKDWKSGKMIEKSVEAASMFDVNKTIMRCLVKNIAVASGLGLYIYAGEDLPDELGSVTAIPVPMCKCGKPIKAGGGYTAQQVADARAKKYGEPLCDVCAAEKRKQMEEANNAITEAFNNLQEVQTNG